jgi:hypothetical protein
MPDISHISGVVGQYPFAVFVGKIVDSYGPWICALTSAGLFSSGFGLFAWELAKTNDDISLPSQSSFHRLAVFFFMAGLGTVFGLFSSLFAAAKVRSLTHITCLRDLKPRRSTSQVTWGRHRAQAWLCLVCRLSCYPTLPLGFSRTIMALT